MRINSFNSIKKFVLIPRSFKSLYISYVNYGFECKWLSFIKSIVDDCGMSNILYSQSLYPKEWILLSVDQRLKDQFRQKWCTEINMSSKGLCYKIFKNELVFDKYLSLLSPQYIYMYFLNTDVVVTDCQQRQEGGTIYLEMIGCATFATQMT